MTLDRIKALCLLTECTGDDIWPLEYCSLRGVPANWIEEMVDCFESGFQRDSETIYLDKLPTNQYEGIRDVDLAKRLGEFLGVDTTLLEQRAASRAHLVRIIKEEVEEG